MSNNPLIDALPPNTDYLTYLTVIEYNLTPDLLPTLHELLQDTKLTVNIGWDLVHLLLPLLPASQQCLQDIARLGNPREVILKVTECLRLIDYAEPTPTTDDESHGPSLSAPDSIQAAHTTATVQHPSLRGRQSSPAVDVPTTPLPVDQFICLVSMLSILHPRIKTQYPSRFLSTSLQAVLSAFSRSITHREELISAIIRFIKDVSGTKRPHLPPRASSSSVVPTDSTNRAPDPEAETDAGGKGLSIAEAEIQTRLLQSILTFVLEDYMLGLSSEEDVPGLCWSNRLMEKLHPERTVPGRASSMKRFEDDQTLKNRLTAAGELLALSQDLNIGSELLLEAAETDDSPSDLTNDAEAEPPKRAEDIPLSKSGSLLLYVAGVMRESLYSDTSARQAMPLFPTHHKLLSTFVTDSSARGDMVGTEPEVLLDSLLALGLLAIENNQVGQPHDGETFSQYLQTIALISSNCPSPSLRYIAYYLTTSTLRSNPSDLERLGFIRDTLEHCPFDNLKVAAVSWIKGETIEANSAQSSNQEGRARDWQRSSDDSIFASPVAIETLAPSLFPDLTHDLSAPSVVDAWAAFDENFPFYLAALNFYHLLLSADTLTRSLNIAALHTNNDIAGSFLGPLRQASTRFQEDAKPGGILDEKWKADGDANVELAKLLLLDTTLEKVTKGIARLNTSCREAD